MPPESLTIPEKRIPGRPIAVFDVNHGQRNWSQTGFTSREMHSNFAGLMELLCRLGCVCSATVNAPLATALEKARLFVIPTPTGEYVRTHKCWTPKPELHFSASDIRGIADFVKRGGRLLAFGYRFGDSFTCSNLRELFTTFGCLLNDDAVIDLQLLRECYPLDAYFDTPDTSLPLAWSAREVHTVRWRTMATFTILPGARLTPLAVSAGGNCISFDRTQRRISFASLPLAVVGTFGRGRVAFFGGPHVFEVGTYGLLGSHDNARFLQNVLRWLLGNHAASLKPSEATTNRFGTFFFNRNLQIEADAQTHRDQRSIAYVERVLSKTGILKALDRPHWLP